MRSDLGDAADTASDHLLRAAVAEEVASVLRHDLRNKFAGIRNASAYIKRSLQKSGKLEGDPRIERFLDLIVQQVLEADEMMSERLDFAELLSSSRSEQSVDQVILDLSQKWRGRFSNLDGDLQAPIVFSFERANLEFCLDRLFENAVEAGETQLLVSSVSESTGVRINFLQSSATTLLPQSEKALTPFDTSKRGHLGIGLNMVVRLIARQRGELCLPLSDANPISLYLPFENVIAGQPQLDSV